MNLTVYCTKETCRWYIDWYDYPSVEHVLNYYKEWNEKHHDDMKCVHNYSTRQLTKGGKCNEP